MQVAPGAAGAQPSATIPHHSTNAARLVSLLRANVSQTQAASILGITDSAVSQLMQTPEVASKLADLKLAQLGVSTEIDAKYDKMENKLLDQLDRVIPMLTRPAEIARVLSTVNQAKRRGITPDSANQGPATIIQLQLPERLSHKFTVNSSNQVVSTGARDLITIQSSNVPKLLHDAISTKALEAEFGVELPPEKQADREGQEASS